jgi:hypothetical protein
MFRRRSDKQVHRTEGNFFFWEAVTMATIHELNERRVQAQLRRDALAMMNTPTDAEEQLRAAARYRLAYDAWIAAENEYHAAIRSLSAEELSAIAGQAETQKRPPQPKP